MKLKRVDCKVEIDMHGFDDNHVIPAFHTEAAKIQGGATDINEISVSALNPFVFYLHSKDQDRGSYGFVATINVLDVFNEIIAQIDNLRVEAAQLAYEMEQEEEADANDDRTSA